MKLDVAFEFVDAINAADTEKIGRLMTDDHVFVNSVGNEMAGRQFLKESWSQYFKMFPDYNMEVLEAVESEQIVVLLGFASGTYMLREDERKSNFWKIPATWKVMTTGGKIKHWQIYADNSVVLEIMNKNNNLSKTS